MHTLRTAFQMYIIYTLAIQYHWIVFNPRLDQSHLALAVHHSLTTAPNTIQTVANNCCTTAPGVLLYHCNRGSNYQEA